MLYLLEHAKARWQVWLLLSPGYLGFAVIAVIFGKIAFHEYEGGTTNPAISVALTAMCAATSIYGLRIVVRRAAATWRLKSCHHCKRSGHGCDATFWEKT